MVLNITLPLQNHLLEMDSKKAAAPTWETVRYMISVIQYGGRITDDFDQLLMDTYVERYFHQGVLQVRRMRDAVCRVCCMQHSCKLQDVPPLCCKLQSECALVCALML